MNSEKAVIQVIHAVYVSTEKSARQGMISGLLFFLERPRVGNSPKSPTATRSRFGPIPEQGSAKPGARPRRTGGSDVQSRSRLGCSFRWPTLSIFLQLLTRVLTTIRCSELLSPVKPMVLMI